MNASDEVAALEAMFRERGATTRSWICSTCGADVDSADVSLHLRGHDRQASAGKR